MMWCRMHMHSGFLDTLTYYEEDYLKEHHSFGIVFLRIPE